MEYMLNSGISIFLIGLMSSALLLPIIIKVAKLRGWVSETDYRRKTEPTPLMGGVSIFAPLIILLGLLYAQQQAAPVYFYGLLVMLSIGFLDDIYQLSAKVKLLGQIIAVSLFLYFINN